MSTHHNGGQAVKRLLGFAGVLLVTCIVGCRKEAARQTVHAWQTVQYSDKGGTLTSSVYLYTPPFGGEEGTVSVLWDGKQIFSGTLPSDDGTGPDGMPFDFMVIHTTPGHHTLVVQHKHESQTKAIQLKTDEQKHFYIFGHEKNKRVLLQDLGPSPGFA